MRRILKWGAICIILFSLYLVNNHFTYDFHYTKGEKDGQLVTSPNGSYSAQVYYQYYGGAAGGVNTFVNVTFHLEDNVERTIYFSDAKSQVYVSWIEEDVLNIRNLDEYADRSVALEVGKEIYDEHGGACGTYKVKKHFICYSKNS